MHKYVSRLCGLWLLFLASAALAADATPWYSQDNQGQLQIHLYFFWSKTCPHCRAALPFIPKLQQSFSWLTVHTYELTEHHDYVDLYVSMAESIQQNASSVPAFLFCQKILMGYEDEEKTGQFLKQQLQTCYQQQKNNTFGTIPALGNEGTAQTVSLATTPLSTSLEKTTQVVAPLHIPLLGEVSFEQFSLPTYTLIIAGLDAFNPCAFFVLLFLLSLLVHTRSRPRMLLIGGIFVFFSGFIYFLFMAAWLNVFLWLGELQIITIIAGLLAIFIAGINIKDFFWFKQGVSLSIPEAAKPDLYQRIRGLVNSTALLPMILSTVLLAIVANAYELLCTAGFPMVYTRILTLSNLPDSTYYLYLVFYNIVYVIPLIIIVLVFTYTLGSRKLAESEGRLLKLMSGLMMLGLGGILLVAPQLLTNLLAALIMLVSAIGLAAIIIIWEKHQLIKNS